MCIVERRTGHLVEHDRCLLLQLRFLGHPLLRGLRINMLPAKSGLDLRLVSGPHRARAALNQDPGRLFTHDSREKNHAHPDAINPERKYFRAGAESRLPYLRAYGEIAVRPRLIGELRSNVDVVKIVSNRRPPFPQLPILLFLFPFLLLITPPAPYSSPAASSPQRIEMALLFTAKSQKSTAQCRPKIVPEERKKPKLRCNASFPFARH